jgi:catechol 2,3-dioxygenase-like lactoylglutathione lyase family enzyme
MPGSRHYQDRGKHLGANRVSRTLIGATTTAHEVAAMRAFYVDKLGFSELAGSALRIPGDSRQELDIAAGGPELKSGIQFGVGDLKLTEGVLARMGLQVRSGPTALTVSDPDGVVVSFVKMK